MITSQEILDRTGLKSTKTLTRWHQQGIIPKPTIETHPSGRGKIAAWPDWVADRCVRIVELRREGHTLKSAAKQAEMEALSRLIEERSSTGYHDAQPDFLIALPDGREASPTEVVTAIALKEIQRFTTDRTSIDTYREQLSESEADFALKLLEEGFNPVITLDGVALRAIPDFMVAHELAHIQPAQSCRLVLSLFPVLVDAFHLLGIELKHRPNTWAVPVVRTKQGDDMVSYNVHLGGPLGFELIRDSAQTLGAARSREESDAGEQHFGESQAS
jgi:hypothetical protein